MRPSFEQLDSRRMPSAGPLPASHGLNYANLVYADSQRLDVHLPPGTPPAGGWPVVLAIHGGGWLEGEKKLYEAKVDPTLLAGGFAVVAPDYPLSTPRHPSWPRNLDDLRQAVR